MAEKERPAVHVEPVMEEISPTSTPKPPEVAEVREEPGVESKDTDAQQRVERREAMQYWGYLVKPNKCGSVKLDRLLAGIATYIVSSKAYGGSVNRGCQGSIID